MREHTHLALSEIQLYCGCHPSDSCICFSVIPELVRGRKIICHGPLKTAANPTCCCFGFTTCKLESKMAESTVFPEVSTYTVSAECTNGEY